MRKAVAAAPTMTREGSSRLSRSERSTRELVLVGEGSAHSSLTNYPAIEIVDSGDLMSAKATGKSSKRTTYGPATAASSTPASDAISNEKALQESQSTARHENLGKTRQSNLSSGKKGGKNKPFAGLRAKFSGRKAAGAVAATSTTTAEKNQEKHNKNSTAMSPSVNETSSQAKTPVTRGSILKTSTAKRPSALRTKADGSNQTNTASSVSGKNVELDDVIANEAAVRTDTDGGQQTSTSSTPTSGVAAAGFFGGLGLLGAATAVGMDSSSTDLPSPMGKSGETSDVLDGLLEDDEDDDDVIAALQESTINGCRGGGKAGTAEDMLKEASDALDAVQDEEDNSDFDGDKATGWADRASEICAPVNNCLFAGVRGFDNLACNQDMEFLDSLETLMGSPDPPEAATVGIEDDDDEEDDEDEGDEDDSPGIIDPVAQPRVLSLEEGPPAYPVQETAISRTSRQRGPVPIAAIEFPTPRRQQSDADSQQGTKVSTLGETYEPKEPRRLFFGGRKKKDGPPLRKITCTS